MAQRSVAESASHLCVWIMGLVAGIFFLQQFEAELKPLVLAFVFVSILEVMVQTLEWFFLKVFVLFVKLLPWKWLVLLRIAYRYCKCDTNVRDLLDDLSNWDELRKPWNERDAGKHLLNRIVSVAITLTLIVLLTMCINGLVVTQAHKVINSFDVYKIQITTMSAWCNNHSQNLWTLFPSQYHNQTLAVMDQLGKSLNNTLAALPAQAESFGVSLMNDVLSSSSSFLVELLFFLLYSAFMLFDPLHINLEKDTGSGPASRPVRQPASMMAGASEKLLPQPSLVTGESEADLPGAVSSRKAVPIQLTELQHYLYQIVWSYFKLTVVVNGIFAFLCFLLLKFLQFDLSIIIAIACFFLAFIPELGAIISMVLPIPFILLTPTSQCVDPGGAPHEECISDMVDRLWTLLWAFGGMMAIKIMVSNWLNALLMGKDRTLAGAVKDDVEDVQDTHGVIVLFAVVFFGKIWGTVGMLISVPVLSVMRLSLNFGAKRHSGGGLARKLSRSFT